MPTLFENRRVLVADDSEDIRLLAAQYLRTFNNSIQVLEADSGEAALEIVEREKPDVLVLDLQMPGLDGMGVLERLRKREVSRFLPVLVLTSQDHRYMELAALEAGADDFLGKPISQIRFISRVQALLRVRQRYEQLEQRIRELTEAAPRPVLMPDKGRSESNREARIERAIRFIRTQTDRPVDGDGANFFARKLDELSRAVVSHALKLSLKSDRSHIGSEDLDASFSAALQALEVTRDTDD